MSECVCRIEKLANGYTVEVVDPDQMKANQNSKAPYKDPWKEFAFKTTDEVVTFVGKVLPGLMPEKMDMNKAFADACAEMED